MRCNCISIMNCIYRPTEWHKNMLYPNYNFQRYDISDDADAFRHYQNDGIMIDDVSK